MNMMKESETKETSATHGAYVQLRNMILTGELEAGKKLKIASAPLAIDTVTVST